MCGAVVGVVVVGGVYPKSKAFAHCLLVKMAEKISSVSRSIQPS